MATIQLGKIKQVWRDAWSNGNNYAVDDLVSHVDQNITSTYIAVQASTSGSPQAPSTGGTINTSYWNLVAKGVVDPIPSQSGQSGKFLKTNGSALSFDNVNQVIKKIHTLSFNTRTGGNNNANYDQFSWGSFTPLDVNNNFFISGQVPANSAGNDYCGFGLRFAGNSGNTDFSGTGIGYIGATGHMTIYTYHFNYTGTFNGADTYTIYHRTYATSSQPDTFCPNYNDDSRNVAQTSGHLQIIEYANA